MTGYFKSERHALFVGWVHGNLMKTGSVPTTPVYDDDGNYTDRIRMSIGGLSLVLIIPEPPDDWTIS